MPRKIGYNIHITKQRVVGCCHHHCDPRRTGVDPMQSSPDSTPVSGKKKILRVCLICGKQFRARKDQPGKYCSLACLGVANGNSLRKPKITPEYKRCSKCKVLYPATDEYFYRAPTTSKYSDGFRPQCKACKREISHLWNTKNPNKSREYAIRRRTRQWGLPDGFTEADWQGCLTYWHGMCVYCNVRKANSIDHFIPLASPDCPGTVRTNILPACKPCNCSKHANDPRTWLVKTFGEPQASQKLAEISAYFNMVR